MNFIRYATRLRAAFFTAALCFFGLLFSGSTPAYIAMLPSSNPTPKLHVTGRYLQDPNGHTVLLHGYYQPAQSYFNGGGSNYPDPTDYTSPSNVAPALNFLTGEADILAHQYPLYNQNHGWYCSFVRLNGTSNNDSFAPGWDSSGNLTNRSQFNGWLQNLVVPYINHCRQDGLYVVLLGTASQGYLADYSQHDPSTGRPPLIRRDDNMSLQYRNNLNTFWQIVASTPGIKNADNVQFELCNEPINIATSLDSANGGIGSLSDDWGNGDDAHWAALTNFLQPLVNTIRQQGADNVIWTPGLGYQSQYQGFVNHPLAGGNVGYAAHFYPGYVSGNQNYPPFVNRLWNSSYKPCADLYPMMITEMYWYPNDGTGYNALFNGITGDSGYGFGTAIRSDIDAEGNVSYLVGFSSDLLANLNQGLAAATVSNLDGAQAAFNWFPDYGGNGPHPSIPQTPVTLAAGLYNISAVDNSGMSLDLYGGGIGDGTPIWQWYSSLTDPAEKFTLHQIDGDNTYWLSPLAAPGSALSVHRVGLGDPPLLDVTNGQSLDILSYNGGLDQQWIVIPLGAGQYRLASVLDPNETIDQTGADTNPTALQTYSWAGGQVNQLWTFAPAAAPVSTPYGGTPVTIPAVGTTTLEAENYDNGGEGVGYHDSDAADNGGSAYRPGDGVDIYDDGLATNGHAVGWTQAGEWMKYTVKVKKSGYFTVRFRQSAVTDGTTLHLEDTDGTNLTGTVTCFNTGGWSNYHAVPVPSVYLSAGVHVLKLYEETGGYNLDNITLTHGAPPGKKKPKTVLPQKLPLKKT